MSYDRRKTVKLATAIVLSSAFCVSCCGPQKAAKANEEPAQSIDSTEQFTPLHPPVVIPHDWRNELKKED